MPVDNRPDVKSSLAAWVEAVAAPPPGPAGGSAAAIAAALGTALAGMVAAVTHGKERYAAGHERARSVLGRATALRNDLLSLAVRDAEAFERFFNARGEAKTAALREAAAVQLELLRSAAAAADLAVTMADAGAPSALGDAATGTFLAAAAARSAYWAMRADLDATSPDAESMLVGGLELLEKAEAAEWRARQILNERIH
ncbi:MAG TPA: cyclodeaminase/cyclohydrolase family protein [Gemmatimonadales bacterium]|jgi:formiminotetrahydrofolate cyclodeaminase